MLLREKRHIAKRLTTESRRSLITSQLYPVVRRKTDNLNQRTTIVEFEQGGNAKALTYILRYADYGVRRPLGRFDVAALGLVCPDD